MNRLAARSLAALLGVLLATATVAGETVDPQAAAQYRRGTELAEHGDHAGAIRAYEEALKLAPNWLVVRNDLGVELYLSGEPRRAVTELRAVLDREPDRGPVHTNLGFALYDLGQVDAAVAEWRSALAHGAAVADTYAGLALGLLKQGKTAEAIRTYRMAVAGDPQYAHAGYLQNGAGWSPRAAADAAPLLRAARSATPDAASH